MRINALLIALIIISAASGAQTEIAYAESVMIPRYEETCNLTESIINQAKELIMAQSNTSPYSFINLTNSYCYGNNINLNFMFKETEESYIGQRYTISIYSYEEYDYSKIFNEDEINKLDYTIKQEYISYLINGTDNEYYVMISGNDCETLRTYFNTLSDEKYFNEENNYCSIVTKTKTSTVKNLLNEQINYINYLGKSIKFNFIGYSEGNYNLESLAQSINCRINKNEYYYSDDLENCYGTYMDKARFYFSTSKNNTYLSVHGYINGKAKIYASAYEEIDEEFIKESLINYLGSDYQLKINETPWGDFEGSLIINDASLNTEALNQLTKEEYEMNSNYYNNNTYVTITEPFIQIYLTENQASQALRILPYYWGRSITITQSRVYTSITLDENNEASAKEQINELVNDYVSTNDWVLTMQATGDYYYYPIRYAEATIGMDYAKSVQPQSGISDSESTNQAGSSQLSISQFDFSELEEKTFFQSVIEFFTNLFK